MKVTRFRFKCFLIRVIADEPGGEARGANPQPGVGSEAERELTAEDQHAAAQQRHAVPAAARRARRTP